MPNFKPKAKKKIASRSKSSVTLDSQHNEKMDYFERIDNLNVYGPLWLRLHCQTKNIHTKSAFALFIFLPLTFIGTNPWWIVQSLGSHHGTVARAAA